MQGGWKSGGCGRGSTLGVPGSVSMWPLGGAAGRPGRDRGRFVGEQCPRVTHCGGGRMSQPSEGFLRPHVPRFPLWRRPGRLHRPDPWGKPEPGAPPRRCAHSPRSRPFEASFSAPAQGPGPAAKPGVGLWSAALRVACCAVCVRTRPAACIFFSGARAPGETLPDRARPLPGFQGGCSPGVPFPGGDRRPFWARSKGSVREPRGAQALTRGEALRLGRVVFPVRSRGSLPSLWESLLSRTGSGPRLGLGRDPRDYFVPGLGCGWRAEGSMPKPLGESLLCFLGVPGCFRLFSE